MKRRKALKKTSLLIGSALTTPALVGLWQSCQSPSSVRDSILSEARTQRVSVLTETILPRTETPGAVDAGVPQFIELILADVSTKEEVDQFLSGMDAFEEQCRQWEGKTFAQCNTARKEQILSRFEKEDKDLTEQARDYYLTVKHFTILGYFSSEAGMTQALNYVQIPGKYEPCADLGVEEKIMVSSRF
ncbi:MAG: gluconate 2-dehydrogenase subunit 3 family protein [Saprospiraceae bacterium]|nr:gluconate 2-dehydrogenase subunit 3 family protein [Saprospiraceae bacterium]